MVLNERHLQLLKHIKSYSCIKRYHGLLPQREAAFYEDTLISELQELGLVEEGRICSSCGNSLVGYKVSKKADEELENVYLDIKDNDWDSFCGLDVDVHDCLDKEHIRALMDIYHLSRVTQFCGIAPKRLLLNSYESDVINVLLDVGFINKISLKGSSVKYRSGFVLSTKASRLLQQLGYMR